jgi:hypothetical protein
LPYILGVNFVFQKRQYDPVLSIATCVPHDLGRRRLWYATMRSTRIPGLMVDVAGVPPDIYLPLVAGDDAKYEEVLRVQSWLKEVRSRRVRPGDEDLRFKGFLLTASFSSVMPGFEWLHPARANRRSQNLVWCLKAITAYTFVAASPLKTLSDAEYSISEVRARILAQDARSFGWHLRILAAVRQTAASSPAVR